MFFLLPFQRRDRLCVECVGSVAVKPVAGSQTHKPARQSRNYSVTPPRNLHLTSASVLGAEECKAKEEKKGNVMSGFLL